MEDPKRPGVYIEEIALLPPSVAGVSTAVPAFLGYTRNQVDSPQKITSLLEFTTIFGAPYDENFTATNVGAAGETSWQIERDDKVNYWLYYLLKMFFNNGGRVCYVVSVGTFSNGKNPNDFTNEDKGLAKLEKEDEPTLIVLGDAANIPWVGYKSIMDQALMQCGKLKDRFAILDVQQGDEDGGQFRGLASDYLRYGAAYTPFLKTSITYKLTDGYEDRVTVKDEWVFFDTSKTGLRVKNDQPDKNYNVLIEKGTSFACAVTEGNEFHHLELTGVEGARAKDLVAEIRNDGPITHFEAYTIEEGEAIVDKLTEEELTDDIKVLKISDSNGNIILIFTYTGDDDPTLNLVFDQDDWVFEYDTDNQAFTIGVKKGEEASASNLMSQFRLKNPNTSFQLLKVGSGVVDQEISSGALTPAKSGQFPAGEEALLILYTGEKAGAKVSTLAPTLSFQIDDASDPVVLTIGEVGPGMAPASVVKQWKEWASKSEAHGFSLISLGDDPVVALTEPESLNVPTLRGLKGSDTEKYNQIKAKLQSVYVTLPPSGALAGVYARVDGDRGVWKAPANVSLMSVIGPEVKITDLEQEALNYHPGGGKSINAIRNFTGKGTLVWGARTLAGNDNEWRYIPVRRLFIYIEESTRKASETFVFEPNNATTWLKVKGMIESFLFDLWQRGALAGPTPEAAYYVEVGLGKTMTQDDILNGKMKVEIGIAAVRPAEFIILKFSHKMQEAA